MKITCNESRRSVNHPLHIARDGAQVSRSTKADQCRSHSSKCKLAPKHGDHFLVRLMTFFCDPTCQVFHSDSHFGTRSAGAHNHGSKGAVVDTCDPLKVFTSSFVGDRSVVVGNGIREVALGKRVEHSIFEECVLLLSPETSNSDVRSRLVTSVCCFQIQPARALLRRHCKPSQNFQRRGVFACRDACG